VFGMTHGDHVTKEEQNGFNAKKTFYWGKPMGTTTTTTTTTSTVVRQLPRVTQMTGANNIVPFSRSATSLAGRAAPAAFDGPLPVGDAIAAVLILNGIYQDVQNAAPHRPIQSMGLQPAITALTGQHFLQNLQPQSRQALPPTVPQQTLNQWNQQLFQQHFPSVSFQALTPEQQVQRNRQADANDKRLEQPYALGLRYPLADGRSVPFALVGPLSELATLLSIPENLAVFAGLQDEPNDGISPDGLITRANEAAQAAQSTQALNYGRQFLRDLEGYIKDQFPSLSLMANADRSASRQNGLALNQAADANGAQLNDLYALGVRIPVTFSDGSRRDVPAMLQGSLQDLGEFAQSEWFDWLQQTGAEIDPAPGLSRQGLINRLQQAQQQQPTALIQPETPQYPARDNTELRELASPESPQRAPSEPSTQPLPGLEELDNTAVGDNPDQLPRPLEITLGQNGAVVLPEDTGSTVETATRPEVTLTTPEEVPLDSPTEVSLGAAQSDNPFEVQGETASNSKLENLPEELLSEKVQVEDIRAFVWDQYTKMSGDQAELDMELLQKITTELETLAISSGSKSLINQLDWFKKDHITPLQFLFYYKNEMTNVFNQAVNKIEEWQSRAESGEKILVVLDIDGTVLKTDPGMYLEPIDFIKKNITERQTKVQELKNNMDANSIEAMPEASRFIELLNSSRIPYAFVTNRPSESSKQTQEILNRNNLLRETAFEKIIFVHNFGGDKSGGFQELENQGFEIVATVGDSDNDMHGSTNNHFLLPPWIEF
jgi:hypothetical protein